MDEKFLDMMKKCAEPYGIEVIENATKGGIFYNDNGKLIEIIEKGKAEMIAEIKEKAFVPGCYQGVTDVQVIRLDDVLLIIDKYMEE